MTLNRKTYADDQRPRWAPAMTTTMTLISVDCQ